MSERTIEYLHGLLDAAERATFEALLAEDLRLSTELQILRQATAWLEEASDLAVPPPELAERTRRRLFLPCEGCSEAHLGTQEPPSYLNRRIDRGRQGEGQG
jgi:hypothetical protein